MLINKSEKFKKNFKYIFEYIAKDKINAASSFRKELNISLNKLDNFPYKSRKSIYFNNENIRDMIFKGYTVIYEINLNDNIIEVLTIFNQNLHNIKE